MKIICKYSIIIIMLLSVGWSQFQPGSAEADMRDCPEVFDNPNPGRLWDDFANYPNFGADPQPWLPDRIEFQSYNNGLSNHSSYDFWGPENNSLYIVQSGWCPDGKAWVADSFMDLFWVDGNISTLTVTDISTGNYAWACYFAGPYNYYGVPTGASYWRDDGTGTQLTKYYVATRIFDANGNVTSVVYSFPEGNTMTERYRTDTVYSTVHPSCPGQQIMTEKVGDNWYVTRIRYYEYHSECGNNMDTYDPTDDANCVPTNVETQDSDGNVVSTEERTLDIGECLGDLLRLYFPSENEYYQNTNQWMQWLGKISTAYDASDYRLVKVDTEYSEDGTNWTNYSRAWISYDGLQMDTEKIVSIPALFELSQNYPNPFNPITTITYELPKESMVSIKIYNSLGNEIRTLVNELKPIGQYQVNWDGTDNSGEKVSGGTYFCQLRTGGFIQTKKMVLLK